MNVLAVGDVCTQSGIDILRDKLHGIKKYYDVSFTVANGENAAGLGITKIQAQELFGAGADVITLGNHTWGKREIAEYLDDSLHILRPANFAPQVPGRGQGVYETQYGDVCVINLIGRARMENECESPFFEVDRILQKNSAKIILVDFHAELTSEKLAMAYYLDGRVSAAWGTHTHVQTSDCRVFPGGMGFVTDVGMTGPIESVIGIKPEQSISRFLGNPPTRYEPAIGGAKIEGAVFEIDADTGKCNSVEAIRVM
ncbi:MAG: TIGR00282 family metallophosphoesterase [Oscillospiraceae bacterium]|nr:TIGR00282 family metallophosphoesterase [Oscillospiraceae bacterium]